MPLEFSFAPIGEPVLLRSAAGTRLILLRMSSQYAIDAGEADNGPFSVRSVGYFYEVRDRQEREVLSYHWHPVGRSPIIHPHLHLSGRLAPLDTGPRDAPIAFGEMHLPTGGPVTLTDIVRLLITEFGVPPRRADWAAILADVGDPVAPDR